MSPDAIPRRSASAAESSTSRSGRWKRARDRSTAGPGTARCTAGAGLADEVVGGRARRRRGFRGRGRGRLVCMSRGKGRPLRPGLVEREVAEQVGCELHARRPPPRVRPRLQTALLRFDEARPAEAEDEQAAVAAASLEVHRRALALEEGHRGRIRSAQPPASSWNIVITMTRSASSAGARTPDLASAASSPSTTSRPIGAEFFAVPGGGPRCGDRAPFGVEGEMGLAGARLLLGQARARARRVRAPPAARSTRRGRPGRPCAAASRACGRGRRAPRADCRAASGPSARRRSGRR